MKKHFIIFLSVNAIVAFITSAIAWSAWYCPIHEGDTNTPLGWWWNIHRIFLPFTEAGLLITYIIYKLDKKFNL